MRSDNSSPSSGDNYDDDVDDVGNDDLILFTLIVYLDTVKI